MSSGQFYDTDISVIKSASRNMEGRTAGLQTPERFVDWLAVGEADLRKAERTRLGLMRAATKHLEDHSLETLTVSAVCKVAGVAHGTFYLHFKDRHDLVDVLLQGFVEFVQVRMRGEARQVEDPVRQTTETYFHLFKAHAALMKCLVIGVDSFPEARRAFQKLNAEWARTVVRALGRNGALAGLDPDEQMRRAYALGGMVDQYLTALFVTRDPWLTEVSRDTEAVILTLTTLWRRGMQE